MLIGAAGRSDGRFLGGKYVKEHLFTTYSCNFSVILCVDYTDERIRKQPPFGRCQTKFMRL